MVPGTFRGEHFPWQVCLLAGPISRFARAGKRHLGSICGRRFAHFEGRSEKELPYTACSYPDMGCVHMKTQAGVETGRGAPGTVSGAALGHCPVSGRKTALLGGHHPDILVPREFDTAPREQFGKRAASLFEGLGESLSHISNSKRYCRVGTALKLLPKCLSLCEPFSVLPRWTE